MSHKIKEKKYRTYTYNGKVIDFEKPLVMGIVNITPNSFYDGGKFDSLKDVISDVESKLLQGADIIDIGAASAKPGVVELSIEEEWQRLKLILPEIRKNFGSTVIGVDTYRAEIAKRSIDNGIDMINDISGGTFDENMFDIVSKNKIPYVLMHTPAKPEIMQQMTNYENVITDIKTFFERQILKLKGLNFENIILDVGFGFGKTLQQNYELLKNLDEFSSLEYPILVGLSRKSMINLVIETNPVTALNGTTTLNTIALLNGAKLLRVHDVLEANQCVKLVDYYLK